jgi:hypothetical protein
MDNFSIGVFYAAGAGATMGLAGSLAKSKHSKLFAAELAIFGAGNKKLCSLPLKLFMVRAVLVSNLNSNDIIFRTMAALITLFIALLISFSTNFIFFVKIALYAK